MTLFLNTAQTEIVLALIEDRKILKLTKWQSKQDESAKLLLQVEELLGSQQKSLKDLEKLMVVIGPGSFTGVRVAVTVANTLSYALKLPILPLTLGQILSARLATELHASTQIAIQISKDHYFLQSAEAAWQGGHQGEIHTLKELEEMKDTLISESSGKIKWNGKLGTLNDALFELAGVKKASLQIAEPFYVLPPKITQAKTRH